MVSLADVVVRQFDAANPRLPRSVNFYFDFYRGQPVMRAVAYLSNSGCAWAEESGGCVMCGTKNFAMHRRVKDGEYLSQLRIVRQEIDAYRREHTAPIAVLCIYMDGLYFNDDEIGKRVRDEIYALARDVGVKKLVVETSSGDIVRDHAEDDGLRHAVEYLGDIAFEIALGVESTNPLMRRLYNKSDTLDDVRAAVSLMRAVGAHPKAYVLLKGPLVTEHEALEDCTASVDTLRDWAGEDPIHIELQPVCLLPNTLHEQLAALDESDPYAWEPPLMSTILRIIERFGDLGENLHSALFAPIDVEQPWSFWQTRPHDTQETTAALYQQLVEHYLTRDVAPARAGLQLIDSDFVSERMSQRSSHSLEERVEIVHGLLERSRELGVRVSDYVRNHVRGDANFVDNAREHLRAVSAAAS